MWMVELKIQKVVHNEEQTKRVRCWWRLNIFLVNTAMTQGTDAVQAYMFEPSDSESEDEAEFRIKLVTEGWSYKMLKVKYKQNS